VNRGGRLVCVSNAAAHVTWLRLDWLQSSQSRFSISLSLSLNPFWRQFPDESGLDGTRTSPFWILLELRMMEVVVRTGAIRHAKLQSNRHLQQINSQCFTGQMSFLSPNQLCRTLKENRFSISDDDITVNVSVQLLCRVASCCSLTSTRNTCWRWCLMLDTATTYTVALSMIFSLLPINNTLTLWVSLCYLSTTPSHCESLSVTYQQHLHTVSLSLCYLSTTPSHCESLLPINNTYTLWVSLSVTCQQHPHTVSLSLLPINNTYTLW